MSAHNRSINEVVNDADYRKQLAEFGINLIGGAPDELVAYVAAQRKLWHPIIQKGNLKLN